MDALVKKFTFSNFPYFWPRPRSVAGLVRTGFTLVALVLLVAIIFAIISVEQLRQQSEKTVRDGVQLTRLSRELNNIVPAMERNARQYLILGDRGLLKSYGEHQQTLLDVLNKLEDLDVTNRADINLEAMRSASTAIYDLIRPATVREYRIVSRDFRPFQVLRREARSISNYSNTFIEQELNALQQEADQSRRFLLLSNAALIPAAIFLAILFTRLITRPVRQIEAAMKSLGEGDFDKPVTIDVSSTEMQALASQLDWLRSRILELENEKNKFLQRISHELKTPLSSVREGADLLMDGSTGVLSEEQNEVVRILHESGNELQALIENLLNFTSWQKWNTDIQLTQFDLSTLIRNVVNRHRLAIHNKSLQITTTQEPVTITADRERIRLALDNLFANAVKFSPREATINITSEKRDDEVIISIVDEGPGIPESEREHVFTPFYQGENSRESPARGTGIGLSVVRDSVFAHNGEIRIIDNEPSGTHFSITIPQTEKSE